ncbi:MAG: aspartyl/asparaginyl beta-hydroxylase domain-containing protein [Cyanobacteria bacterium J06638_22]
MGVRNSSTTTAPEPIGQLETCLTLDDMRLTQMVYLAIAGDASPQISVPCLGATYVGLREGGKLCRSYWCYDLDLWQLLSHVMEDAIAYLSSATKANRRGIDTIELCLTHSYRSVEPTQFARQLSNIHRGIRGMEVQYKDHTGRYSPTRMIASNLSFGSAFDRFLTQLSLSPETFWRNGGTVQAFEARQVLIRLAPQVTATTLHRGNRIVPYEKLSGEVLQDMTFCMGQWMLRQVQSDGRMIYKYFPSRGEESTANNLIRQFMATLCLIRYAKSTGKAEHQAVATQNLQHNIQQFYQEENDLGFVEYQGKVKLGAVALAALALLEYSDSATIAPPYAEPFDRLCATIDTLWNEDGSFRSFYKPSDRNDNQNFYPGEALLFWASLYCHTQDPVLLDKCYASFRYYKDWHLQHRNPAFIPWHTQAYTLLYRETGDRQFLDFIFEMNDWLLPLQQWEGTRYADVQGRFYDPDKPYGPPHASSTGVYLEGLAEAYQLAVKVEDADRAQPYQQAIWHGFRSVRQLQFRDAVDWFYISKTASVHGGLRTTVYDNVIRVDNVQHCLMALLKLEHLPEFTKAIAPPFSPDPSLPHSHIRNVGQEDDWVPTPTPVAESQSFSLDSIPIIDGKARQQLNYFRLIEPAVDIQPLLNEIEANENLWLKDTSRQDNVKVQRETHTIYLRSAVKPFPSGVTSGNDVHPSRPTRIAEHFPTVLAWAEQFAARQSGELGRVTLVRLAPKGRVYPHIDQGEYYRVRDRYHLILHSPTGSILAARDEWVRLHPGECWWFNNKEPHQAYNESDDWRIHLIFDVKPSDTKPFDMDSKGEE